MNKDETGTLTAWNTISRIAAFFASIAVWWVSINFSVAGFNFSIPNMLWIGWVLGICVTVIEIVFNKPGIRKNLTLWIVGAMAYLYGMGTNIYGIWLAQGSPSGGAGWIFPVLLGSVLEWIPEVLFVWSILGTVTQEGDFIGNIIKMFSGNKDEPYSTLYSPQKPEKTKKAGRPSKKISAPMKTRIVNPNWQEEDTLGKDFAKFQQDFYAKDK